MSPDLPVMDVCSAAVSFDIFLPWLWIKRTRTTANMGLLNGFPFCFVLLLCLSASLFASPLPYVSHLLSALSLHFYCALTGVEVEASEKKAKLNEDASGLVPYGGDSSDEEEESTHSSKTDNS